MNAPGVTLAKKRLTYADVEADVSTRFPLSRHGDHEPNPNARTTWAGNQTSYSDYFSPRPQTAESRERKSSKTDKPETPVYLVAVTPPIPKTRSARLKKRRPSTAESPRVLPPLPPMPISPPPSVRRPSTAESRVLPPPPPMPSSPLPALPPVPTASTEKTQRPRTAPSSSESKPPSSLRARSMWLDRRLQNTSEKEPPASVRHSLQPSAHAKSSSSASRISTPLAHHSRARTPASLSTSIDEQEYLDLADYSYPAYPSLPQAFVPVLPTRRPSKRSRHESVATTISMYSQQSLSHELQTSSGSEDSPTDEIPPSRAHPVETLNESTEPEPSLSDDQRSIASVETIQAPKPRSRRLSSDSMSGWLEYDSDTQSLRTIPGDDASEFDLKPPLRPYVDSGYYTSGCSTPTAVGGVRSSVATSTTLFSKGTPPMSPTTLIAASRFSGHSQDTQTTLVPKLKPIKEKTKSKSKPKPRWQQSQKRRSKGNSRRNSRCSSPSPSQTLSFIHIDPESPAAGYEREFQPISSRSSVRDEAICLDYDYNIAVNVLVYGASISSYGSMQAISEDELSDFKAATTSYLSSSTSIKTFKRRGSSSRKASVGVNIPVSGFARTKQGTQRRTSFLQLETTVKQKKSLFSQVSHLFVRAG